MKASIIKPGLLVSLKTSIVGGVAYQRQTIEGDHIDDAGQRVASWETRRAIQDPDEYERAKVARGKSRSLISGACAHSSFGLLCPMSKESDLADAITQAHEVADKHNEDARLSRVQVYVLVGRIAQDDAEAARAIGSEVRDLLDTMRASIKLADVDAIREAASKAKGIGSMLSQDVGGKVASAIKEARSIAREIVRRVEKGGELAADIVASVNMNAIDAARFSFLDLDTAGKVESEAPASRGLDFDAPAPESAGAEMSAAYRALEL